MQESKVSVEQQFSTSLASETPLSIDESEEFCANELHDTYPQNFHEILEAE